MDVKKCTNSDCVNFNQVSIDATHGGETFCSECGQQISSDSKLVTDLEFSKVSKPVGRFIINDIINGKLSQKTSITCFTSLQSETNTTPARSDLWNRLSEYSKSGVRWVLSLFWSMQDKTITSLPSKKSSSRVVQSLWWLQFVYTQRAESKKMHHICWLISPTPSKQTCTT